MTDAFKNIANLSPEEKRALLAQLLRKKADEGKNWSPLSHGQRALWFLYCLAPESAAYNLLYAAYVRPMLDVATLQRAVQALVERYPILTATYSMEKGEPIQRFHKSLAVPVEEIDSSAWNKSYLEEQLLKEGNRPFDLQQGPVLRIKLFKRTAQESVLSLTVHHIAADLWALDLLVDELCTLYAAERVGVQAPLPPVGPQFADYVQWQSTMLAASEGEQHWTYWQHALAGELPLLNLPTDRPRPTIQTYKGASHSFALSEELTQQLKVLAYTHKTTLYTTLLAAFQVLLFRYTAQEDILIGTPMLGRSRAELERVVGYLVNPVVLRAHFSHSLSFKEFLHQVRTTVAEALEHQDYPFPLLVERLQPKRDPSYSPIFQTLFIWDKPHTEQETLRPERDEIARQISSQKLRLEVLLAGQQGAHFDLTLTVFEVGGLLSAEIRYNVDLFDASTIVRMEKHFLTLLTGIVAQPEQRLLDLPLLTEAELQRIVVAWNDTSAPFPEEMCIHQLIESQVQQTPNAVAVIFEGEELTYRELNARDNQLAHALQERGVEPDTLVGVCMERSFEMVIALLAILKAGGAYVPLDPEYPQERLAYMIQDARLPVLLTQKRILQRLPHSSMSVIFLDDERNTLGTHSEENPVCAVQPHNLVYMIYTSGSTGRPKGVMNIHKAVCNRLHWMQQTYRLTAADRVMQKTPFSFDVSAWEFFWPLMAGAGLVMARPGGQQDTAYLVSLIVNQSITTLHFVPSMLQMFLLEQGLERCTSLKRVICSGEALSYELQERFFSRINAELHNLYGPTEAAIDVTYWQCQRRSHLRVVPIGRPIANTHIYILDQAMQPVPVGVAGELYIGGVGLARGYFNRAELTAEKFVHDPFAKEADARLFKTGDLARYRADGAIEFLGRLDHQVKIRGFRIELGEVEAVLAQHPAVNEVVVLAREDTPGNQRLVAYVVPFHWALRQTQAGEKEHALLLTSQQVDLSVEALRGFLREKLPYYMLPSVFLFLRALPLTPNGKLDRRALPAPDMTRPELAETYVAPRTPTEELLCQIWAQVLGLKGVGIHDNFFDLGGASIQSLEVIAKAREVGLHLAIEMLFEYQTVAELAAVVGHVQTESEQQATPALAAVHALPQPAQADQSNTLIESLGVYLPPKVVSTAELLEQCKKPIRFPLAQLTGINTRRMAGETEFSLDLAKKAVAACLTNSKYKPEDIDLLINGSIARCKGPLQFVFEPNLSVQLRHHFGFTNALVFDVSNACTGLFTAIYIADAFLKAGLVRRAMVVSGEYTSHLTLTAQKEIETYMDSRLACLTVGDAAAALILERSPSKKIGFHEFEMYTLGRYWDYCIAKATEQEHGGAIMYTDAVKVSAVNMQQALSHATHIIERSGWPYDAFQHLLIHQTSKTTIQDAPREINRYFGKEVYKPEAVINNIAERGNTATTTQMVTLMDHIRLNTIKSGENVIFGITGSGATIGTALYTFDDLPDRLRRIESGAYTPEKVATEQTRVVPLLPSAQRVRVESIGTPAAGVQRETMELVRAAGEHCLARSSYERCAIDLLIYTGIYRDEFLCEPSLASIVAGMLKINDTIESQHDKKTFALDLFNGAIGFLSACYTAISMIKAGKVKNTMIVASEIENNRVTTLPTELRHIEEDGSCVILDESPDGKTGFGNFVFKYFTDYIESFSAYTVLHKGKTCMHFEQDPLLETYYLRCIQDAVDELLRIEQLDIAQVKTILPPQISSSFIAELSRILKLPIDKFVDMHREKDLFTSSLPYALQYVREQRLVQPGDICLLISVATGIQVGCATYYF